MTFENKLRALVRLAQVKNLTMIEMLGCLKELLLEYNKEKKVMNYDSWQGKSTFEIKRFPEKVIVTKYQKNKNEEPRPVYTEIPTRDLNLLLYLIKKYCGDGIKTRNLAEHYCRGCGMFRTSKGKSLFEDGIFIWDNFFSWRKMHNRFTIMLNVLAEDGYIEYVGGNIKLLQ